MEPDDRRDGSGGWPTAHDADARVRPPDADGPAPREDVVLHTVHGRGGDRLCLSRCLAGWRHELPDLSAAGPSDRRWLPARAHDVPGLLEHTRPVARPPDARHVFGQGLRVLLHFGQRRHAIRPGRWVGDGFGHQRRDRYRCRLDRGRRDRGIRFPRGDGYGVDLQRAGDSQHREQPVGHLDQPGGRPRPGGNVCHACPRFRTPLSAS